MLLATPLIWAFILIVLALKWWKSRERSDLHRIPSVKRGLWNILPNQRRKWDAKKNHLDMMDLKQQFGPIVKLRLFTHTTLLISDFEAIYEMLVKRGKECGGRMSTYRTNDLLGDTGILLSTNPDDLWRMQRKVAQKHLKQFGDGLSRLESIIGLVAEDMFTEMQNHKEEPFDPRSIIFDTALNSIAFLITGQRTHAGDPLVEKMRQYEKMFLGTMTLFAPLKFKLLNIFPFLKHVGFDQWPKYQCLKELHRDIWEIVKEMNNDCPEAESIYKVFSSHIAAGDSLVTERDAQSASLGLLLAGVTTTSNSFYATINILAHHPAIQDKLYEEILKTEPERDGKSILAMRSKMHYARAFLFEVLRFTTIVPNGVQHRTTEDTELGGYKIPANIILLPSLYNLHHDEEFWGDPFEFRPERYLDDAGEVIPADHPNRTHLMPFGAGTRVCLGESLALGRLFIWITTLIHRFQITPAEGNEKSLIDSRNYAFFGVLQPGSYKVVFKHRS